MWQMRKYVAFVCAFGLAASAIAQTNLPLYTDSLASGFQDWSWGTHSFSSASPVHSGNYAISFNGAAWEAVSFWHSDINPAPYTNLTFWAHGGAGGGQILQVYVQFGTNTGTASQLSALTANAWKQYSIPFSALGAVGVSNLNRINLQLTSYGTATAFSLDDVNLTAVAPAPVHLTVNASQTLRTADARWFGLNTAVWDGNFDTPTTSNALAELGTQILRFPGGSLSDEYHWTSNTTLTNTWTWATSFDNFKHIATNGGCQAIIIVNYGTGTSNEAAAWVKSANVTNRCGFKYWEIGNECYGTWETDSNSLPHDPYTYAVRAAHYLRLMKAADTNIEVGVVAAPGENSYSNNATHFAVNPRTGTTNYGWTPILLSTLKSLGVTPDFLVHHVYPEYISDNDQTLLLAGGNWGGDAADLRRQIQDYFGSGGTNIELLCTENNADSGNQGRQSTSLVNGLYLADSLAQLEKTEFNGFVWWDLRNGTDYNGDFSSSLYGWRSYGDLGIINGLNTRHPVFYAFKLMSCFARAGDTVLNASSDFGLLPAYAARTASGALALLVVNKDRYVGYTAQVALTNFVPGPKATVRSYGIDQDEAARTNGAAVLQDIALTDFPAAATNFNYVFPPYSLTLFTFVPAAAQLVPRSAAGGQFVFQLRGQPGTPYVMQTSTNLPSTNWLSVSTNTLAGSTLNFTNPIPSGPGQKFWRAAWRP
jgi:alpha-L-arabinofuranosidase